MLLLKNANVAVLLPLFWYMQVWLMWLCHRKYHTIGSTVISNLNRHSCELLCKSYKCPNVYNTSGCPKSKLSFKKDLQKSIKNIANVHVHVVYISVYLDWVQIMYNFLPIQVYIMQLCQQNERNQKMQTSQLHIFKEKIAWAFKKRICHIPKCSTTQLSNK